MANRHCDWRLHSGIASLTNFCILLAVLASFPLVLRWTGALDVGNAAPATPEHTRAFIKACLVLTVFLWTCFGVALTGMRRRGMLTARDLIGLRWNTWQAALRGIGTALSTLVVMAMIGQLSNALLGPWVHDTPAFSAMVSPQNSLEALAFLVSALTAGFVEEFVFRGYIQNQCQALFGNPWLASIVQVILFTSGHLYQGWARLVPVALIGAVLTAVALWRKSLLPGMIAHATGDGLVTLIYFAKHL